MLDTDTKRRINTCRDILVGKVPDPKSQVEQITIALIYKFMDDMDLEAEAMGFPRKFFTGGFERYAWAKLVAPGVGGQEMLNTYSEALGKMVENDQLPALFRSIFRNAYLPYRDPETLRSFLREIDGFRYDHSERLGDAFEYLLSVLGSQGDAGQFRTPRHIIDFMVEIIDPKKNETILDPACGTAGFLISSYKHILKANSTQMDITVGTGAVVEAVEAALESPLRYAGDLLTPENRQRLAANIKGYDISPDMVRLSLVNLYLHGFLDPKVEEYDTLTSEDKWGEVADVILANPPFMSPKGGIRPHNRFSVPSKRSEVLFVDYIAEHLSPRGRAAIIVPEGVIFQSQSAYCELRRMLVDKYLVAVISLPAGVFNPYSGVKTSILILDRVAAKAADSIAFFKIDNDGFGLGAQRRVVKGGQLLQVKTEIGAYLDAVRGGEAMLLESSLGQAVAKARIAEGGDYNLSGERYRDTGRTEYVVPRVPIGEICAINPSKSQTAGFPGSMPVSFVPMATLNEYRMDFVPNETKSLSDVGAGYTFFADGDVLLAKVAPCFENGKAGIARKLTNGIGFGSSEFYILRPGERVLAQWIYHCITHPSFRAPAIANMNGTGGLQRVPRNFVERFAIPLPPLEVQQEIVAEVEGYLKVIDGARAVLENYRPHIPLDPTWPIVAVSTVGQIARGASPRPIDKFMTQSPEGLNWIKIGDVREGDKFVTKTKNKITLEGALKSRKVLIGDLILSNSMSFGRPYICAIDGYIHDGWLAITPEMNVTTTDYLYYALGSTAAYEQFKRVATGGVVNNLNSGLVGRVKIPLPPLATQEAIVREIEAEQSLVDANRDLIGRFEQKIEAAIARVWGGAESAAAA